MILTILLLLIFFILLLGCLIMLKVLTKVKKKKEIQDRLFISSLIFIYFYSFINKRIDVYRGNKFLITGTIF